MTEPVEIDMTQWVGQGGGVDRYNRSFEIERGKPGNQHRIDYGRWFDWGSDDPKIIAAALAHRADVQHALVCAGDVRGVFGDYPPAEIPL